jgi:hypothetical protein
MHQHSRPVGEKVRKGTPAEPFFTMAHIHHHINEMHPFFKQLVPSKSELLII